jgi:mRNA interferase HigB
MRVISRRALREFWRRHPRAEGPLRTWYAIAHRSEWRGPADVKRDYQSASFRAGSRVVFNIKGNDYRLVAAIRYDKAIVFIRFVGTHAQYDRIDAATI